MLAQAVPSEPEPSPNPGSPGPSPEAVLARLRELHEAVVGGRQDPRQLTLAEWSREVDRAFRNPPEPLEMGEAWLDQAGEALRLLSELCALKAQAIAPPAAGSGASPSPAGADPDGDELQGPAAELAAAGADVARATDGGAGTPGASEALQTAASRYVLLQQAAQALARQAERFALHQPRPEQAARSLLEVLQRLGPWPADSPGVSPQELARALTRVLRRRALADAARRAPAPALDWPRMMDRVRALIPAEGEASLEELLGQGHSRAEVIALFLAMLELVRMGELCLTEDGERGIRVARRHPSPAS